MLTTKRAAALQHAALITQAERQEMESIRADRRRAYAQFFRQMQDYNILYLNVYSLTEDIKDVDPNDKALKKLRVKADKLWNEWRQSYAELELLAGVELDEVAGQIFRQYTDDMEDAFHGVNPDRGHKAGGIFPIAVLAAMQAEIGIQDGVKIDPDTGLRADQPPGDEHKPY